MSDSIKQQIVGAASALLDLGGQSAVTMRAVAQKVGVSHTAPYRHFRDRNALLAAVAERDLVVLKEAFEDQRVGEIDAEAALKAASKALIDYGLQHAARYRLLFSDPALSPEANLGLAALDAFKSFEGVIVKAQADGLIPQGDSLALTGLVYATLHGAIDLELGGRASETKGLGSIAGTAELLFSLLERVGRIESLGEARISGRGRP